MLNAITYHRGSIAQLVEQLPFKETVAGSIPAGPTTNSMFTAIWDTIVFKPLFNFLIFLYQRYTGYNLGIAVVYMTLLLRIVLLPLSVMAEQGKEFYRRIHTKISEAQRDFADDPVRQKQAIRELLKRHKIRPWTRVVVLLFHILILIALYQVFVGGLTRQKFGALYPSVAAPDFINTNLFCFDSVHKVGCLDIAQSNLWFAAVVAIVLFIEITLSQRGLRSKLSQPEIVYRFLFPAFTFVALALLPSVKSVFILTSLLFSIIISLGGTVFFSAGRRREAQAEIKKTAPQTADDPLANNYYGRQPR
ncbi:MAG: preprotein translocase subunit YidC [Parcubacteria group bacterium Gr01-1014_31]|nr:MAG: preprotein translocase subunit YidC [Parcubacteria group bacterium Gr01-1014_31]